MATLPNLTVGVVAPANVVKSVQALLVEKFNQSQLGVNGSYGEETIAALKVVQAFLHMPVTGEVDQAMWAVLLTV
jgi:peptidoglycan hydrolase-like protein with peptidoglycan-binding domain